MSCASILFNYNLLNSVLLLVTPPYFVCFGESSSIIAENAPNLGKVTCSNKGKLFFCAYLKNKSIYCFNIKTLN